MTRRFWIGSLLVIACLVGFSAAQTSSEPAAAAPSRVQPPSATATARELEKSADELRQEKLYLDAIDYYREALKRSPANLAVLHNKIGITQLQMGRYPEAKKSFERAIKSDKNYPDARNNLGVIHYIQKKYGRAIKEYRKAIALREDSASFHSNLGTAYFARKEFEKAAAEYQRALDLDPDVFEHRSLAGVSAQMSSPEDRAYYNFVLARMYAKAGNLDRALNYLRKAMEEGYKEIGKVYEENEFAGLRKDPRFSELMASKPLAIPQ